MNLHYVVGSPNCRKVHAVINHLGLVVDMEYYDFFNGELRAPQYLAINPNGMVPALRDGDRYLHATTSSAKTSRWRITP